MGCAASSDDTAGHTATADRRVRRSPHASATDDAIGELASTTEPPGSTRLVVVGPTDTQLPSAGATDGDDSIESVSVEPPALDVALGPAVFSAVQPPSGTDSTAYDAQRLRSFSSNPLAGSRALSLSTAASGRSQQRVYCRRGRRLLRHHGEREPFTSDLQRFDTLVAQLRDSRDDGIPFHAQVWDHVRGKLAQLEEPVGLSSIFSCPDSLCSGDAYAASVGSGLPSFHEASDLSVSAAGSTRPGTPGSSGKGLPTNVFAVPSEVRQRFASRLATLKWLHPLMPGVVAEELGLPLHDVLTEMFEATLAGLCSMQWVVACDHCTFVAARSAELEAVPTACVCPMCGVENRSPAAERISAVFILSPEVLASPFLNLACRISPKLSELFVTKMPMWPLEDHAGQSYTVDLEPGAYRAYCIMCGTNYRFTVRRRATAEDAPATFIIYSSDVALTTGTKFEFEHGRLHIVGVADTDTYLNINVFRDFDVEDQFVPRDKRPAQASAVQVMHHAVFAKHFKHQTVSLMQGLLVERVFMVFTDLVDSTATYERLGDGEALRVVQDHFDIVFEEVERRSGRVIKTMGDAAMCSFLRADDALVAVVGAMRRCAEYAGSARCPRGASVRLKVGIHAGNCLLLPINGVNDYFGQAVNIAARVQAQAQADEVVVSPAVQQCATWGAAVAQLQAAREVAAGPLERRVAQLKGVTGAVELAVARVITA